MNDPNDIPKEVANILTKETVREIGRFLEMVLGEPLKGIGGIVSDQVSYWRYKNLLKLKDKVDAIRAKRALEGKTLSLPPRYAIPLIENASTEDDETIQDLWAGLIANAVDPGTRIDMKRVYIDVLGNLEPLDALVMEYISKQGWKQIPRVDGHGINDHMIADSIGSELEGVRNSLINLHRMNCIEVLYPDMMHNTAASLNLTDPDARFRLSQLGISLLKACRDHGRPEGSLLEQLLTYVKAEKRVCPNPDQWNQLYKMLPGKIRAGTVWNPPLPLILAAWHETSNSQKRDRLEVHIRYAADKDALEKVADYLYRLSEKHWVHEEEV